METQESVMLPIALGVADNFQTFLVNFFIVDLMLPYEAILTLGGALGQGGSITTTLMSEFTSPMSH
jgi:hypothetical protein